MEEETETLICGFLELAEDHKAGVPVQVYLTPQSMPLTITRDN